MISAFVVTSSAADDPNLRADLDAVGVTVLGEGDSRSVVPDVIRSAPDVVICYEKHPDDTLFTNMAALSTTAPRAVVVFTSDPDAEKIERATQSGIHAYVVNGYARHRLRSIIHVAQARFRQDRVLRDELVEITARFDERKLVDRAKGILMRARQISEDEAYRVLRTAAMQTKQRLGQVSRHVINAALYGDAVNRAGQLRMLSQRLVKLHAARAAGLDPDAIGAALAESARQTDDTIAILRRGLSKPTFGDLIDSVANPWARLKAAMASPATIARLPEIDDLAEDLLRSAERLTTNLETAGLATKLRVINVSGRQRMLAQRMAKLALMTALIDPPRGREAPPAARDLGSSDNKDLVSAANKEPAAPSDPAQDRARTRAEDMAATVEAFSQGLDYLKAVPLSTAAIRDELDRAGEVWLALGATLSRTRARQGQRDVVSLSETLVERFERLTEYYERSLQMLLE
jgi:AmiR/NasT family two-component response regulator